MEPATTHRDSKALMHCSPLTELVNELDTAGNALVEALSSVAAASGRNSGVVEDISDSIPPTDIMAVLSDDAASVVLGHVGVRGVVAAATTCHALSRLCRADALWQQVVLTQWPLMPERLKPAGSDGWRTVAQARVAQPRWLYACPIMDEIERVCEHLDAQRKACERIATLVIGLFATPLSPLAHPQGLAFREAVRSALAHPERLGTLERWARARSDALDDFYEGCGLGSATASLARRSVILDAMRCASALTFVQDELMSASHHDGWVGAADLAAAAGAQWAAAGLPAAIESIASGLASLELEGFNVAIPPHLQPPHVPRAHKWWQARPPLHASGRIHYC